MFIPIMLLCFCSSRFQGINGETWNLYNFPLYRWLWSHDEADTSALCLSLWMITILKFSSNKANLRLHFFLLKRTNFGSNASPCLKAINMHWAWFPKVSCFFQPFSYENFLPFPEPRQQSVAVYPPSFPWLQFPSLPPRFVFPLRQRLLARNSVSLVLFSVCSLENGMMTSNFSSPLSSLLSFYLISAIHKLCRTKLNRNKMTSQIYSFVDLFHIYTTL